MKGVAILCLLLALIVTVSSETCTRKDDCQETTCTGSNQEVGCSHGSHGMCTCFHSGNNHLIPCHTKGNCYELSHCDHKYEHCIDNVCRCSDTKHHDDD